MDTATSKRKLAAPAAVFMILAAVQMACALSGAEPQAAENTPTADTAVTAQPAGETAVQTQAQPEATKEGDAEGGPSSGGSVGDFACFATSDNGVTCLNDGGWKTYTEENTDFYSLDVEDMAACPDGKIYASTFSMVLVFDGRAWEEIPPGGEEYIGGDYIACGAEGSIWVGGYKGIHYYKDGEWGSFAVEAYATGEYPDLMYGLEIAPDGTVWVATARSISAYDGTSWKEYTQGSGFDVEISPAGLAVDSKNRVWMIDYDMLYLFENGGWNAFELKHSIMTPNSLLVDPQDRLWINTDTYGALILDGDQFSEFSYNSGDLHSNGVFSVAFDKSGKTWVAMEYGIDILSGDTTTHYRMDNADLADNKIIRVAVVGNGPALPAEMTKQPGSIVGSITVGGKPLAGAEVEFCVEELGFQYVGETPCSSQPFMKKGTTDAEGNFSIADVPTGYYYITVKVEDGWIYLYERIPVAEGKETDIGELKVKED
ncbi:MAG: hypothetical protein JW929_11335 [Anaerolineales bacterium]|nr:hypothetical protein [Anaerolineales bacterium]